MAEQVCITSEILDVAGLPTSVLKAGEPEDEPDQTLAVIIPGNPGAGEFYEEFMRRLHSNSKFKLPVWCVSHAGHVIIPKQFSQSGHLDWHPYDIKGQIQHKLYFLQHCVPKRTKLVLIGHSIGCLIILQLLERFGSDRITKCYMLFPTIERMAESPKGKSATPVLKFHRLLPYPVYLFYFLPAWIKIKLCELFHSGQKIPPSAYRGMLNLFNPNVVGNFTYMAHTEMEQVVTAPYDIIEKHEQKLVFYYGATDGWTPMSYYEDIKRRYPDMDVKLDDKGMAHAFVLEDSEPMADVLWEWVKNKL